MGCPTRQAHDALSASTHHTPPHGRGSRTMNYFRLLSLSFERFSNGSGTKHGEHTPRTRVVPHPKAQVSVRARVRLVVRLWCWVWIGSGERSVCTQKRVMENQHPTRRVVTLQGRGGYAVATPELGVGMSLGNNGPSSVWLCCWVERVERVGRVGYLCRTLAGCALVACAGLPANCEPVRRAQHFG